MLVYSRNDKVKCNIAETKSPNLKVPSFRMYFNASTDSTSVFSWNPVEN